MALVQLINGHFQDAEGNVLDSGYLIWTLSHDEQDPSTGTQIASGLPIRVGLDNIGNVADTQKVWATDVLLPAGAYYIVEAFRFDGTTAWKTPQFVTVPSGTTYDLGTFIPSQPIAQPPAPAVTFQTNGVNNGVQNLENLVSGTNITLVNSGGNTTISSAGIPLSVQNASTFQINVPAGSTVISTAGSFYGLTVANGQTNGNGRGAVAATGNVPSGFFATTLASNPAGGTGWCLCEGAFGRTVSNLLDVKFVISISSTSNGRFWVGLIDQNANDPTNLFVTVHNSGNTPNANVIAFRYSPNAGDTTPQCYCSTSSSNLTSTAASGFTIDTNPHVYEFQPTASSVKFLIDGNVVGTVNTNIPSSAALMQLFIYFDNNLSTTAQTINFYNLRGIQTL